LTALSPLQRRGSPARQRMLLLAVLLAAALLSAAPPARASTQAMVMELHQASATVSAPYFRVNAKPGGRQAVGTIQLFNRTSRRLAVRLDPVDGITANALGSLYGAVGEPIHGSALWLRLGSPRVSIPAGGSRTVSVAIDVPGSAGAGDFLSGVSVQSIESSSASELKRSVAGVELLLPGPREPRLTFTGARAQRAHGAVLFSLYATNSGNVILKEVRGHVLVTQGAHTVLSSQIGPGTFVSHTSIEMPIEAIDTRAGRAAAYRIRAQLFYKHQVAKLDTLVHAAGDPGGQAGVWRRIDPGIASLLFGGLLALLLAVVVLLRRRRCLLSHRATLRLLERMLPDFDEREQPLSVIRVAVDEPSRSKNRRLARLLRLELLTEDVVCELSGRGLLIVLPDTAGHDATDLCTELALLLAGAGAQHEADSIETATADSREDLDELVQWLRASGLGMLGRGRAPAQNATPALATSERSSIALRPSWSSRLCELFGPSFADLGNAQIEALVEHGVRADADLSFRATLYGKSAVARRELCRDVAAMRNDRGGVIVLGVADRDSVAVACPGVRLSRREERRMRETVASGTAPHAAFSIQAVKGRARGRGYYLLIAEPSPLRPHAVLGETGLRYPRRDGPSTRYLSEIEVADVYRDRFRGERAQIDRLGKIGSEILDTVKPANRVAGPNTPWLIASLVPNNQRALMISAAGRDELEGWARAEHVSLDPIDGFFEHPPAAGVAVERYTVSTVLDSSDEPPHTSYLEVHNDGATAAARAFHPQQTGDAHVGSDEGATTISESQLVQNALLALRVIGRSALHNAGAYGDAIVELRITGCAMSLAGDSTGLRARAQQGRYVERAVSRHTVPIELLAGDRGDFLVATRMMLADIFHAFGIAEVPHITQQLRLRDTRDSGLEPPVSHDQGSLAKAGIS
jgi:hypothetical protein